MLSQGYEKPNSKLLTVKAISHHDRLMCEPFGATCMYINIYIYVQDAYFASSCPIGVCTAHDAGLCSPNYPSRPHLTKSASFLSVSADTRTSLAERLETSTSEGQASFYLVPSQCLRPVHWSYIWNHIRFAKLPC